MAEVSGNNLMELMESVIFNANQVDRLIRERGLQNSQAFLNWQDKLNEISVRNGD